uniref:HSF-type DNA-binding domain-containing protein n=1 Tax=Sus scrofa TaxID=9823 RepID=A0A4X1SX46_PIG
MEGVPLVWDTRPLRMAGDEEGPAAGRPPLPPATGAPALGSASWAPPEAEAEAGLALGPPGPAGRPDLRLLLEEAAFQALMEEPLFRRPPAVGRAPSQGEASLLSLPFPEKLWRIVSSEEFTSIWWDEDGACIGINEKLFQKEVLERAGRAKVFQTDSIKSFARQLNLYGFSKTRQDVHTSVCQTSFLHEGRPISILSKIQYYRSPWFKRDCPQLLRRMKRRVGVKSTSRQEGGRPAAPAPAFPVMEPPGGLALSAEPRQEPHHLTPPAGPETWAEGVPAAAPGTESRGPGSALAAAAEAPRGAAGDMSAGTLEAADLARGPGPAAGSLSPGAGGPGAARLQGKEPLSLLLGGESPVPPGLESRCPDAALDVLCLLFRATPAAPGRSRAGGWIRAAAAGLHNTNSGTGC